MPQESRDIKTVCLKFRFSEEQASELNKALSVFDEKTIFAVRSSSPEEDLEGSSFAGGYETVLGVTVANIEKAVVQAFVSCLDERVAV